MNSESPLPYRVLPSHQNPLLGYYGKLCVHYEQFVMNFMQRHGGAAYGGGVYEFRLYPNNCLVMVFPDRGTLIQYSNHGSQQDFTISLECLSLVASAFFFSIACQQAYEQENEVLNNFFHDCAFALRDALCGELRFVVQPFDESREPTSAEIESAAGFIDKPHPEVSSFFLCID